MIVLYLIVNILIGFPWARHDGRKSNQRTVNF